MDTNDKNMRVRVLMFPWLALGHISPFLELAKKLAERNFHIYFCSTAVNLSTIKQKLTDQKYSISIQLVELHLPTLPDLPPHYHTTTNLPPHLMRTLKQAFDMAKPNFSTILKTLNPDLLIYDALQPWAPGAASTYNIPAVEFMTTGAAMTSFVIHLVKNLGMEFPFSTIYFREYENAQLNHLIESCAHHKDEDRAVGCLEQSSNIVLIRTFREIEGKYIDYLSVLLNKKIVPVGPLVQNPISIEDKHSMIIEWLDKKDRCSTVYVSFGSEYFLSKDDMEEIAHGLELSNVNFIWLVRFPVGEGIRVEEALPEGFFERVGERGMVVEGWAPQPKILGHASTGGFVSHCGWGSVMEGMKYGVPIIAIPMQLDQPLNARLLEDVGVGVEVVRDKDGRLEREKVATVIKQVVVEKTGEDVRRKAREFSDTIRKKGDEEMDEVVEELVQLCRKGKGGLGVSH